MRDTELVALARQHEPILLLHPTEEFRPVGFETFLGESALFDARPDRILPRPVTGADVSHHATGQLVLRADEVSERGFRRVGVRWVAAQVEQAELGSGDDWTPTGTVLPESEPGDLRGAQYDGHYLRRYGATVATRGLRIPVPRPVLGPGRLSKQLQSEIRQAFQNAIPTYHVREAADAPSGIIGLRYQLLWPYNDWNTSFQGANDHEGDWEEIVVWLRGGSVVRVSASAHLHFNRQDARSDGRLRMVGDHPIVFVAGGSHANYFEPGHVSLSTEVFEVFDKCYSWGHWIIPDDGSTPPGIPKSVTRWGDPIPASRLPKFQGTWGAVLPYRRRSFGELHIHIDGPSQRKPLAASEAPS